MGSDTGLGIRKRRSPRSPLDPRAGPAQLEDDDDEDFGTPDAGMHEGASLCNCCHSSVRSMSVAAASSACRLMHATKDRDMSMSTCWQLE